MYISQMEEMAYGYGCTSAYLVGLFFSFILSTLYRVQVCQYWWVSFASILVSFASILASLSRLSTVCRRIWTTPF